MKFHLLITSLMLIAAMSCKSQTNTDCVDFDATYRYQNEDFKQILCVKKINNRKISFRYSVQNNTTKKISVIEGDAIGNSVDDTEVDENENGISYLSTRFIYEHGKCALHIQFDIETYTLANVINYGEKCTNEIKTPISAIAVMKRTNGTINLR